MPATHIYNWKHGWIPITPTAVLQKNHGRMPKHGSKASAAADRFIRTGSSKSSTDHVKAATEAVKAGDHATAINHLTAAIGKSSGAEREALKAHRDKLASKVMHGSAPGKSSGRKSGVHRITNASGQHQYVSGPGGEELAKRSATDKHQAVERHTTGHEQELASAPKAVRSVWDAARQKGWSVSLFAPKEEGEPRTHRTIHDVQLVSPDRKIAHKLTWVDGKRTTYGNPTSTRKALADINTYEPSKSMDSTIRSAARKSEVPTAPQSKEDRFLAEARAKQAKIDEARRQQIAAYEAAQARQKEARDAIAAKIAKEKQDAENARKAEEQKAAEQKVRAEHATELSNQAARAYKAGDYDKAAKLLDQAAASDPSRADTFKSRRDRVAKAKEEAKGGNVPADVQRLRQMDAERQAKKDARQKELDASNAEYRRKEAARLAARGGSSAKPGNAAGHDAHASEAALEVRKAKGGWAVHHKASGAVVVDSRGGFGPKTKTEAQQYAHAAAQIADFNKPLDQYKKDATKEQNEKIVSAFRDLHYKNRDSREAQRVQNIPKTMKSLDEKIHRARVDMEDAQASGQDWQVQQARATLNRLVKQSIELRRQAEQHKIELPEPTPRATIGDLHGVTIVGKRKEGNASVADFRYGGDDYSVKMTKGGVIRVTGPAGSGSTSVPAGSGTDAVNAAVAKLVRKLRSRAKD